MTHNTRESAKKVLREYYGSEQDVPDGLAAVLEGWHHHQLQKARQDWLRSEIEKLEGMKKVEADETPSIAPNLIRRGEIRVYNQALQTIIDRYHSELDQDKK